jgi:hypothetical protein
MAYYRTENIEQLTYVAVYIEVRYALLVLCVKGSEVKNLKRNLKILNVKCVVCV